MNKISLFLGAILAVIAPTLHSIELDGSVVVRLPDDAGEGLCINSKTDSVSIHLRRLIVKKESGFFTEDSEYGVILNTAIFGYNKIDEEEVSINYPRAFRTPASDYETGLVSLPIEMRVAARYPLSSTDGNYETFGLNLDFSLIRKKKENNFGIALEKLADISESIVPPGNPFGKAFGTFASFASAIVDETIDQENQVDANLRGGRLSLAFSSGDTCSGGEEKTGTIAVIRQHAGIVDDGVVDVALPQNYCWRAQYSPIYTIMVSAKPVAGDCAAVESFVNLSNPHYLFVINADRVTQREADLKTSSALSTDYIRRCESHDISLDVC